MSFNFDSIVCFYGLDEARSCLETWAHHCKEITLTTKKKYTKVQIKDSGGKEQIVRIVDLGARHSFRSVSDWSGHNSETTKFYRFSINGIDRKERKFHLVFCADRTCEGRGYGGFSFSCAFDFVKSVSKDESQ